MAKMNEQPGRKARLGRGGRMRGIPGRPRRYPEEPPFEFKTDLARRLWELRQQNIMAGAKLMNADEINEEVARRRGQRPWPDAD